MENELKILGLDNNEIKVYLSLLGHGETSVGPIINDTHLHRQSVYNTLASLKNKELITEKIKNNIHHFLLANPDIMIEKAKQKEMVAKRISHIIKTELEKSQHINEINVYDGREKIRKFFITRNKEMSANSTLYAISNYAHKYEKVIGKDYLAKKLDKLHSQKNIKVRVIAGESYREEYNSIIKDLTEQTDRKMKYIKDELIYPLAVEIWAKSISFFSFEDDWFVIEIKNAKFSASFIQYFQALWRIAKK